MVCPNWVVSKTDGDMHYIGAIKLMELYHVNPAECIVCKPSPRQRDRYYQFPEKDKTLIKLTPRHDGNYEI